MKTIIIRTEALTRLSLSAAVPAGGVMSVRVTPDLADSRNESVRESYQSYRNPRRFDPAFRIELVVEDAAVAAVFDAVSFAYGAGFFSDAEMWVEAPELALSA